MSSCFSGRPILRMSSGKSSTSVRCRRCRASWPGRRTRPRWPPTRARACGPAARASAASCGSPRDTKSIQDRRGSPRTWPRAWRCRPALADRRNPTPGRRKRCSSRHRTPWTPRTPPVPAASTSRSANVRPAPAPKYSSAMLRPPTTVAWLSAVNDLLCMRRFTRVKSVTKLSTRLSRMTTGL